MKVGFFAWAAGKIEEAYLQHRLVVFERELNTETGSKNPRNDAIDLLASEPRAQQILLSRIEHGDTKRRLLALTAFNSFTLVLNDLSFAIPGIARSLVDEDPKIRGAASFALLTASEQHTDIESALPALVKSVMDPDWSTQKNSVKAIGNLNKRQIDISAALSELDRGIASADPGKRAVASLGFEYASRENICLDGHIEPIANLVLDGSNSAFPGVRYAATSALLSIAGYGPRPLIIFQAFSDAIDDRAENYYCYKESETRILAARGLALARSRDAIRIAKTKLIPALGDKDDLIAQYAFVGLMKMAEQQKEVLGIGAKELDETMLLLRSSIAAVRTHGNHACIAKAEDCAKIYYLRLAELASQGKTRIIRDDGILLEGGLKAPRGSDPKGFFRSAGARRTISGAG